VHWLAQIVARGGKKARLVLACFRKLTAFLMYFIEQMDILNGNHRLIGECRHKLDLLVRKRLRDCSCNKDHSFGMSLAQERNAKRRSKTANPLGIMAGVFRIRQDVGKVNHSAFKGGPSHDTPSIHRNRVLFNVFLKFSREAIPRADTVELTFT
jgi:hypothetical protein